MASPWIIATDESARDRNAKAHEAVVEAGSTLPGVRRLVHESWQRSLRLALDPDRPLDGMS